MEIRRLAEAGCRHTQVDEPLFARLPDQALEFGIENLERCFRGVIDDVTRTVHSCCGYPDMLGSELARGEPGPAVRQFRLAVDAGAGTDAEVNLALALVAVEQHGEAEHVLRAASSKRPPTSERRSISAIC